MSVHPIVSHFLNLNLSLTKVSLCGLGLFACLTLSACPAHLPLQNQSHSSHQNNPMSSAVQSGVKSSSTQSNADAKKTVI